MYDGYCNARTGQRATSSAVGIVLARNGAREREGRTARPWRVNTSGQTNDSATLHCLLGTPVTAGVKC